MAIGVLIGIAHSHFDGKHLVLLCFVVEHNTLLGLDMSIGTDLEEIAFVTDDGQFVVEELACSILVLICISHHIRRGSSTFGNRDDVGLVRKVRFFVNVDNIHRERSLRAEYLIERCRSCIADAYFKRIPYSTGVFPSFIIERLDTSLHRHNAR